MGFKHEIPTPVDMVFSQTLYLGYFEDLFNCHCTKYQYYSKKACPWKTWVILYKLVVLNKVMYTLQCRINAPA